VACAVVGGMAVWPALGEGMAETGVVGGFVGAWSLGPMMASPSRVSGHV
jgi:hypothetical protein